MTAFLITVAVLHLLSAGMALGTKPNQPRLPKTVGDLLMEVLVGAGFAAWAIWLLMTGGAA